MKFAFICVLASCLLAVRADSMLGPGIWSLISISKCPDELENEVLDMDIDKHRVNRTHEGFDAKIKVSATIDDNFAAFIDVCKFVEGGCKQYQVLSDNSMVNMLNKYAKDMVTQALTMAKLDPPEFPVNEGTYEVEDFVMDWCVLPRNAPYGKYEAITYLLKNEERVGCSRLILEFNKFEDDNFCDDEEK